MLDVCFESVGFVAGWSEGSVCVDWESNRTVVRQTGMSWHRLRSTSAQLYPNY